MPLRDHFRPPLDDNASWEELHGGWPMVIVQQLRKQLPAGYVAGPRVHFNLYAEVLAFIGHSDPTLSAPPPHIYATSCRWVKKERRAILEAWSHVLTVGQPLPTLPLWLTADIVVPLDLEQSYEQACHDLWIT